MERVTLARRVLDRESEMRAEGLGEADVQAWRVEAFGDEAAARLAALDRRREAWDARMARYRDERAEIEADPRLEPSEAAAEVDALRARSFGGPGLLRIRALDEARSDGGGVPR